MAAWILAWRASTSSRYSTGESPPIKAGQPEPSPHLGTAWEGHHIYEDLTERSSAIPGGIQELEIPPSLNSKRADSFFKSRWFSHQAREFYTCKDSIIRLFFCKAQGFYESACRNDCMKYYDYYQFCLNPLGSDCLFIPRLRARVN